MGVKNGKATICVLNSLRCFVSFHLSALFFLSTRASTERVLLLKIRTISAQHVPHNNKNKSLDVAADLKEL